MAALMHGFPPAPEGQATLANWRTAPFNRWAFQHVREIVNLYVDRAAQLVVAKLSWRRRDVATRVAGRRLARLEQARGL